MYRPNVSMVVYRRSDGRFLLVHKPRRSHAWQFPQGGVEPGETLEGAAKRELREELGTDAFQGFLKSQHVYFYPFPPDYPRDRSFIGSKQNYFFVEFLGEDQDLQLDRKELNEYRWVYQNELVDYLESPEYLQKIRQVIDEFQQQL